MREEFEELPHELIDSRILPVLPRLPTNRNSLSPPPPVSLLSRSLFVLFFLKPSSRCCHSSRSPSLSLSLPSSPFLPSLPPSLSLSPLSISLPLPSSLSLPPSLPLSLSLFSLSLSPSLPPSLPLSLSPSLSLSFSPPPSLSLPLSLPLSLSLSPSSSLFLPLPPPLNFPSRSLPLFFSVTLCTSIPLSIHRSVFLPFFLFSLFLAHSSRPDGADPRVTHPPCATPPLPPLPSPSPCPARYSPPPPNPRPPNRSTCFI